MRSLTFGALLGTILGACGDTDSVRRGSSGFGDGGGEVGLECSDADGDGYGPGCDLGPDCNDNDAAQYENCPAKPCSASDEARECKVNLPSQGDTINCFVGVQYCVDGKWGACQEPIEGAGGGSTGAP